MLSQRLWPRTARSPRGNRAVTLGVHSKRYRNWSLLQTAVRVVADLHRSIWRNAQAGSRRQAPYVRIGRGRYRPPDANPVSYWKKRFALIAADLSTSASARELGICRLYLDELAQSRKPRRKMKPFWQLESLRDMALMTT